MPNIKQLTAEKALSLDGIESKHVLFSSVHDFDIVKKYRWTINNLPDFILNEIPYIELHEYRQNVSQFLNALYYRAGTSVESFKNSIQITDGIFSELGKAGNTDDLIQKIGGIETTTGTSVFGNLYVGDSTGRHYKFPLLTEEVYTAANEWSDASDQDNLVGNMIKNGFKDLTEAFNAPGKVFSTTAFTETVKTYKPNTEGNKIKLKITLYNTQSTDDVTKHYEFVVNFMKVNKHIRTNRTNLLPPVYYKMTIPGVRYSPACFVSSLSIRNEGKTRIIDNKIIPDAYNIEIELTDLVSDCANLIGDVNPDKVNVIQSRDDFIKSGEFKVIPASDSSLNIYKYQMALGH